MFVIVTVDKLDMMGVRKQEGKSAGVSKRVNSGDFMNLN
jgi:hypothetical protein